MKFKCTFLRASNIDWCALLYNICPERSEQFNHSTLTQTYSKKKNKHEFHNNQATIFIFNLRNCGTIMARETNEINIYTTSSDRQFFFGLSSFSTFMASNKVSINENFLYALVRRAQSIGEAFYCKHRHHMPQWNSYFFLLSIHHRRCR